MVRRLFLVTLFTGWCFLYANAAEIGQDVSANGFPATLISADETPGTPVVLFIAGSGPTDRDGNNAFGVKAAYLAKLAGALADRSIGSLRYDKRGVPGSIAATDESLLTIGTFVEDAAAVLDWLRGQVKGRPIILAGHSEGGLIALELATNDPDISGIILLATPGRRPADTLRDQIETNLPEPLRQPGLDILSEVEAGRRVDDVPEQLLALFRPSVQPFLYSMLTLDPAERLRALPVPALVVGGGRDLQVGRADFDALAAAGGSNAQLWMEPMNHVLVEISSDDPQANMEAYANPDAVIAPGVAEAVAGFVGKIAKR